MGIFFLEGKLNMVFIAKSTRNNRHLLLEANILTGDNIKRNKFEATLCPRTPAHKADTLLLFHSRSINGEKKLTRLEKLLLFVFLAPSDILIFFNYCDYLTFSLCSFLF
jgi:hypothetical protein